MSSPSLLERVFQARTLFVLSAIFIVYATTIPFQFDVPPTLERAELIPFWDPLRHRLHSIPDMAQNVALFLPFGFFGFIGLGAVRRRGGPAGALLIAAAGFLLSTFVELLQTMSLERSPSATDIATNTIGALCGAIGGALFVLRFEADFVRWLERTSKRHPGTIIVLVLAIAAIAYLLAPFIPSLDVGILKSRAHVFLADPLGKKALGSLPFDALLFAGLAFLACLEVPPLLIERGIWVADPEALTSHAIATGIGTAAFAVLLEIAKFPLIHHSPALLGAVLNVFGALVGTVAALAREKQGLVPAETFGETTRKNRTLALVFAIGLPVLRALAPFELRPISEGLSQIGPGNFVPFWTLFATMKMSTFVNVFEAASAYLALGWVLAALGRRPATVFLWALVVAEGLEVLQIGIVGRISDVTEGILAAAGALAGAYAYQRLSKIVAAQETAEMARTGLFGSIGSSSAFGRPGQYE
jgi:glycopeptide antibiotics resistance protein